MSCPTNTIPVSYNDTIWCLTPLSNSSVTPSTQPLCYGPRGNPHYTKDVCDVLSTVEGVVSNYKFQTDPIIPYQSSAANNAALAFQSPNTGLSGFYSNSYGNMPSFWTNQ